MDNGAREPDIPVGILLVDDHEANRVALRGMLSGQGYRVVEASSGTEALRALLDDEFAVLFIDVMMPGMNGYELAHAIKARERSASIPILFMTAQAADLDSIYRGYRAGAVDYLVNPLIIPIIPEMVRAKVAVFAQLYRQRKLIERQAAQLVEAGRKESEFRLVNLQLAGERRYRTLADAVPNIVWTAAPDGRVDYFNRRWFEYTGLPAHEAPAWERVLHSDDAAGFLADWRRAVELGEMFQAECRLVRAADGQYRWHLCRAVPERGPSGNIVAWQGTFTDIEDEKRAQAALMEFRRTLDAVHDAVFIFELETLRFLYANQGAVSLLGHSREALLAMRAVDVISDLSEGALRNRLEEVSRTESASGTIEARFVGKDERSVAVEVSLQVIRSAGGRVVWIARDISERKRIQQERELLYREAVGAVRARDEFLSIASHELRTPLTSLQLQLQMALRPESQSQPVTLPSQTREKLEKAAKQVERLNRLITVLMDVSKIAVGRMKLELEQFDLAEAARDVVARYDDEAKRARCTVSVVTSAPVLGTWDRFRLEQVITNLISNALRYGAGAAVEITVQAGSGRAHLSVTDHGIGIAPEDRKRIFRRYEQASARSHGGLGLGLFIAREIVEAHGGEIHVESQLGAGSTFAVELPLVPAPAARERHDEAVTH